MYLRIQIRHANSLFYDSIDLYVDFSRASDINCRDSVFEGVEKPPSDGLFFSRFIVPHLIH